MNKVPPGSRVEDVTGDTKEVGYLQITDGHTRSLLHVPDVVTYTNLQNDVGLRTKYHHE